MMKSTIIDWKVNNKVKYDPDKMGDFDYRDKEGTENETDSKE